MLKLPQILNLIKRYLSAYKLYIFGFIIALIITSSSVLTIGFGLRYLIDQGFNSGNEDSLFKSLLILFGIIVTLAIATFYRFYLITFLGERVIADIRKDVFSHLTKLSAYFFERAKIGELMSQFSSDLSILQTVLTSSISIALRNSILFLGSLTVLLFTNFKLTILVFAIIPFVIFPIIFLGKKLRRLSRNTQEKIGVVMSIMEEYIAAIKTVQAFCNEKYVIGKFNDQIEVGFLTARKRIMVRSLLTATVIIIVFTGIALIIYQGGLNVINGSMSSGELTAFLFYAMLVASSFGSLSEVFGSIQKAAGASDRIVELLNTKQDIQDLGNKKLPQKISEIKFDDVSFAYPSRPEMQSLENINFTIKSGEKIAIVGASGAGKSTIFELLLRFYDVKKGSISFDGINIKDVSLQDLRNNFSLVSQDNIIFSDDVFENIAFAKPDSKKQLIENAAKQASAHQFIKKLPKKYQSFLGEKGIRISGGEKQRINIARAILKNAPILLLDEATSNLDSENEKIFHEFLSNYGRDKTILIIAHRMATVKDADRIIVIDEGSIVEVGTHDDLMKQKGVYAKLVKMQFGD